MVAFLAKLLFGIALSNFLTLDFLLQVFAGCKPLLDKTLGILVEGLMDTFLSLFHENQDKDFTVLDVNGFCQLMLEVS